MQVPILSNTMTRYDMKCLEYTNKLKVTSFVYCVEP